MLSLLELAKPKPVRVELENGSVYLRSLSASELVDFQRQFGDESLNQFGHAIRILALVLCDEQGQSCYTEDQLRTLPTDLILTKLLPEALRVSGLGTPKN